MLENSSHFLKLSLFLDKEQTKNQLRKKVLHSSQQIALESLTL